MDLSTWLRRRWNALSVESAGREEYWQLGVDHLAAHRALSPLIARHVSGLTLDVGAGHLAWRPLLAPRASRYLAADLEARHPDVDLLFDVQQPFPIAASSVRTIFCHSVLEHVPHPWSTLEEFARILEPGGVVILSVPFLYYLHDPPRDYYRFTRYGVRRLAEEAGLEVLSAEHAGGLSHAALHAVSMVISSCLWHRTLHLPARLASRLLFAVARAVDAVDRSGRFAQTVNAVLRLPKRGSGEP